MLKCFVENCGRDAKCFYGKEKYCLKHYKHLMRHGKILNRTIFDKNEIIVVNSIAEIILYDKNGDEVVRGIIDSDCIDKVSTIKFHYNKYTGYIESSKNIKLQNIIMDFVGDRFNQVDHVDRNKLNNRKNNLRIVTAQENVINRGIQKNNVSGITGVSWDKSREKWYACIQYNHKMYYLGLYDNIDDAINARKSAEIKYFGEVINR